MSDPTKAAVLDEQSGGAPELPAVQIREALAELLKSSPFRASKQSQQLLTYIVEQTLSGNGESLKERVIGVEVFGRRANYDSSADPIVRSRATEVRRRLAQYYQGEGGHARIRIEMSLGSYHASFSSLCAPGEDSSGTARAEFETLPLQIENAVAETVSGVPNVNSAPPQIVRFLSSRYVLLSVASLLLLIVAVSFFWIVRGSAMTRFWQPLYKGAKPLLIYTGSENFGSGGRFVTVGDLSASVKVAALLSQDNQRFDIRSGEDIAFDDLRQFPTVLIGCFNNQWTLEVNNDLQFTCSIDKVAAIKERTGAHRQWSSVYSPDRKLQTDYAVVDRLVSSKVGQPLIIIAGIADSGTLAAAEFITSPQRVKELALLAPKGWEKKNLQFVLETKVVNNIPSSSKVVAVYSW